MSSYYDAFGGTSTDGPDDPFADELELERRDAEMSDEEPDYNDPLHADYSDVESKARVEDGPEREFWDGLNDEADDINIVTGEVEE